MEHAAYVAEIKRQADALRAAAVAAGPDAKVPTCPKWTVQKLVAHIARVHGFVAENVRTPPDVDRPGMPDAPREWEPLLDWWTGTLDDLVELLSTVDPNQPCWVFPGAQPAAAGFWARRQAHETAIHRLDAEHALAGDDRPASVPGLLFEPELAADGVDELLTMLGRLSHLPENTVEGTVLYHAADAGRAWRVRLVPGGRPEVSGNEDSGVHVGATVAGTADALYRAVWGRPSTAVTTGDARLVEAVRAP